MPRNLFFVLLGLFVIGAVIGLFLPVSQVKKLEIVQNRPCVAWENFFHNQKLIGKNLVFVSSQKIERDLKSQYQCARQVTVKKRLPSRLVIEVDVSEPIARIENTNLFLTPEGLVVEGDNQKSLPILYSKPDLIFQPGQKTTDSGVNFALALIADLARSDFAFSSVRVINGEEAAVYGNRDLIVIFSQNKDVAGQVDSLQLILSKAKIEATKIAKIDLRFDKPFIVNR